MSMTEKKGGRQRPQIKCGPGRTKQSFKKQCDITGIVNRYANHGTFDHVSAAQPVFADVSEIGDFRSLVHRARRASEAFDRLPPELRERFANDPARLVEFIQDDANLDEARKLGIVPPEKKKAKPPATEPPIAKEPPADPKIGPEAPTPPKGAPAAQ